MSIVRSNILQWILGVSIFFTYCPLKAQSFTSRIYTSADGLPDSFIGSIYQDSKGYLWIGTLTSLCRYDGKQFLNYGQFLGQPDLAGGVLLEDHLHRFWIGSRKRIFLLRDKQLRSFPLSDAQNLSWIFSMSELKNGKIWLMTDKGVYEFKDTIWQKVPLLNAGANAVCRYVVEADDGLYLNFGDRVIFQHQNGEMEAVSPVQNTAPYYLWLKKYNNEIYVNSVEGIYRIDRRKLVPLFEQQMKGVYSFDFIVDSKKRTWISTEKYGLFVSDPGNVSHLKHTILLPFNQTLLFTEDKEGNVWASNYEGLLKMKESFFEVYDKNKSNLIDNIRHLAIDRNGLLLASSSTNGFISFDKNTSLPNSALSYVNATLKGRVIDASAYDDKGDLWLIARGGTLFIVRKNGIEELNKKMNDEYFEHLTYDSVNKTMYVCGKKIYSGNADRLMEVKLINSPEIKNPKRLYVSKGGLIVWTGSYDIFLIGKEHVARNMNKILSLKAPLINFQFIDDPDGGFWINSTGKGLEKYYWNDKHEPVKVAEVSTNDGLPNNFVAAATFDDNDRLWAATLSGLVVIAKQQEKNETHYVINRIDDERMFAINNWGEAQLVTDGQGKIWLSSFHEIIRLNTDKLTFDTLTPAVQIENVLLDLEQTDWKKWTDSIDHMNAKPLFVRLPYRHNTISIEFNAITFSHADHVIYAYKLEGLNNSWNVTTTNRFVSFANLSPGHYNFLVKAKKPNTSWSNEEHFAFVIRHPYWTTWWFRGLVILAVAGIISFLFRMRIQRIRKKAVLQRQLQNLELKALKAQMNPHFIYNALNSIQSLIMDNRQTEAVKYVGKFARLLRQVLEHSDDSFITLEKELASLELYIQLEALRLNAPLNYEVYVDDQIMPEKEQVPPLIIQPYVENSLWHGLSRKQGEKKLWIAVSATDQWLFVRICDNGIGRRQAQKHKQTNAVIIPSKGMTITEQRLVKFNEHHEEVTVEDLYDEKEQPLGTEVTLRIKRTTKA